MNRHHRGVRRVMLRCSMLGLMAVPACLSIGRTDDAVPTGTSTGMPDSSLLEMVVLAEDRTFHVELRVTIDDLPLGARWNSAFKELFSYFDRNDNGNLETDEAGRLPTAFAMRQLLWGQWGPSIAANDQQQVIARGRQTVDVNALAEAYARAGVGTIVVATGKPPASAMLTATLLQQIDEDRDGQTIEAEWQIAEARLLRLDRDDNELIEPDDLRLGTRYPAAAGSLVLDPPRAGRQANSEIDSVPMIVLPALLSDTDWTDKLVDRLDRDHDDRLNTMEAKLSAEQFAALDPDRDQFLTASELIAWRLQPAEIRWVVQCSPLGAPRIELAAAANTAADGDSTKFQLGKLLLRIRGDSGTLVDLNTIARQRFEAAFAEVDADNDGVLTTAELEKKRLEEMDRLFPIADRDADGRLSATELNAWLDLTAGRAANQVLLTLLDCGPGLFELLDVDGNGGLCVRELRGSWERLGQTQCVVDNRLDTARLPRQLSAIVSRGQPQSHLATAPPTGPGWFRAMDSNRDGVLSAREFLGPSGQFLRFDQDRNGLLDAAEADAMSAVQVARDALRTTAP